MTAPPEMKFAPPASPWEVRRKQLEAEIADLHLRVEEAEEDLFEAEEALREHELNGPNNVTDCADCEHPKRWHLQIEKQGGQLRCHEWACRCDKWVPSKDVAA